MTEAVESGGKIDKFAEETDRYTTLEGALACLLEDCNVQGLNIKHDEPSLFDGH